MWEQKISLEYSNRRTNVWAIDYNFYCNVVSWYCIKPNELLGVLLASFIFLQNFSLHWIINGGKYDLDSRINSLRIWWLW